MKKETLTFSDIDNYDRALSPAIAFLAKKFKSKAEDEAATNMITINNENKNIGGNLPDLYSNKNSFDDNYNGGIDSALSSLHISPSNNELKQGLSTQGNFLTVSVIPRPSNNDSNCKNNNNNNNNNNGKAFGFENEINLHKLSNVLSHEKALDIFVQHLGREFSIECLLSLIEFIQFENYVWQYIIDNELFDKYNNNDNNDTNTSKNMQAEYELKLTKNKFGINLPENVPLSGIFYDEYWVKYESMTLDEIKKQPDWVMEPWTLNCKIKCYKLYQKYIRTGSEYEINISSRNRSNLIEIIEIQKNKPFFNNLKTLPDFINLLFLFKPCADEMFHLLYDSFSRFQKTNRFEKLNAFLLLNR